MLFTSWRFSYGGRNKKKIKSKEADVKVKGFGAGKDTPNLLRYQESRFKVSKY